jgi:hypothetical protein
LHDIFKVAKRDSDMSSIYDKSKVDIDLAKIGPGIWYTIHTLAINAKTDEDKQFFVQYIAKLTAEFPCNTCKQHLQSFVAGHPLQKFFDNLFLWSHSLHNDVNARLKKPILKFDDAMKIYKSECTLCQGTGHNSSDELKNVNITTKPYKTKGKINPMVKEIIFEPVKDNKNFRILRR